MLLRCFICLTANAHSFDGITIRLLAFVLSGKFDLPNKLVLKRLKDLKYFAMPTLEIPVSYCIFIVFSS